LATTALTFSDLQEIPPSTDETCTFISTGPFCNTLKADPFTLIITLWTALQLIWVSMLLTVQLLQIARGLTTYEAMTPPKPLAHRGAPLVTTTDASMSSEGGSAAAAAAADPHAGHNHGPGGHKHGPLEAWKRLLGVDTFMAVAVQGRGATQGPRSAVLRNPFSRGFLTNCSDFWISGEPWFASQEQGASRLGGERVNYTDMYEVPNAPGYVAVRTAEDEV
jgi:palmitoyltransferase ZDHHC13/17